MAELRVPTQDNLRDRLPIRLGETLEHRLREQALVAMPERIPCHQDGIELAGSLLELLLREIRMRLRLDDGWLHAGMRRAVLDGRLREIRKPDGPDLSLAHRALHRLISMLDLADGLVEEQQVDVVRLEPAERLINGLVRTSIDARPELRRKEDLATRLA